MNDPEFESLCKLAPPRKVVDVNRIGLNDDLNFRSLCKSLGIDTDERENHGKQ